MLAGGLAGNWSQRLIASGSHSNGNVYGSHANAVKTERLQSNGHSNFKQSDGIRSR